jgi:hypothetical protein
MHANTYYEANSLLASLKISNPLDIESVLESMAPSMAEYDIQNSVNESEAVSVRSNYIQSITHFGRYKIVVDYDGNIAVEDSGLNEFTDTMF